MVNLGGIRFIVNARTSARIGLIGDIMLGDQPLRTGYGIHSELHGDYTAVFSEFDEYATRFDFVIGNFPRGCW